MTTSGSSDWTLVASQVVEEAFDTIGVYPLGTTIPARDSIKALRKLNAMLKTWSMKGPYLWTKKEGAIALLASTASFDLASTLNPLRVLSVRYRNSSGYDLPMAEMSRDEYFNLPVKTSTGVPTRWFFDPQPGTPALYIWPLAASVTTETLRATYQRRVEDIDSASNDLDIPQEWLETVSCNLGDRLLDSYSIPNQDVAARVTQRAAMLLQDARDFEREDFVDFIPERR
jgi:hypothetical protein